MKVLIEIDDQFLFDQCVSGAIGYWACGFQYGKGDEPNCIFGAKVQEIETKKWFKLDWKKAVRIAVKKYPRMLDENRMDATTGDMWIQLAAFGELIYG